MGWMISSMAWTCSSYGLDFFEIPIRRAIFARCHALGIPAITAAPIGAGPAIWSSIPAA